MATTYIRRNYLTKKDFQARFMLPFIVASLLANVITVTLFIFLARNKIDGLLFSMRMSHTGAGALLAPAAFLASIVAVVALSLSFLWAAQGMYHKIAGPLHQIREHLHKLGAGDLSSRINLRQSDEFRDFAGEINAMAEALKNRFTVLNDQTADLANAAGALKASPQPAEAAALRRHLAGVIRTMEQRIGEFKR
jgi:methyl-accepting chemotaxis protein